MSWGFSPLLLTQATAPTADSIIEVGAGNIVYTGQPLPLYVHPSSCAMVYTCNAPFVLHNQINYFSGFYVNDGRFVVSAGNAGFSYVAYEPGPNGNPGVLKFLGPVLSYMYLDRAYTKVSDRYTIGFAVSFQNHNYNSRVATFFNSVGSQLSIYLSTGGYIRVYRGHNTSKTLLFDGTGDDDYYFGIGQWRYIEFAAIIDNTAGSFSIRIDGQDAIMTTQTGIDTQNQADATIDTVMFGWDVLFEYGNSMFIDDFYYKDMIGDSNGFIGKCYVYHIAPDAEGDTQNFTPSTGTMHWSLVDDRLSATDYLDSATVNDIELFNAAAPPEMAGVIAGAKVCNYVQGTTADPRTIASIIKTSGVIYGEGKQDAITTSFAVYEQIYPINPATGVDWISPDFDDIQIGVKNTS